MSGPLRPAWLQSWRQCSGNVSDDVRFEIRARHEFRTSARFALPLKSRGSPLEADFVRGAVAPAFLALREREPAAARSMLVRLPSAQRRAARSRARFRR